MENADWTECDSPLTVPSSQCSLGNDQCPDQLEEATNVLSNHKFDQLHCDTKSKKAAKEKADKEERKRPTTAHLKIVQVPLELHIAQHNAELCIDAMFASRMPFLTSVFWCIKHRSCQWVPLEEPESHIDQLSKSLLMCQSFGFQAVHIFVDNAFEPVLEAIKTEFAFQPNCADAQEHVPEVEWNHRVIKEKV